MFAHTPYSVYICILSEVTAVKVLGLYRTVEALQLSKHDDWKYCIGDLSLGYRCTVYISMYSIHIERCFVSHIFPLLDCISRRMSEAWHFIRQAFDLRIRGNRKQTIIYFSSPPKYVTHVYEAASLKLKCDNWKISMFENWKRHFPYCVYMRSYA